jgi:hypothetical protein
MFTKYEIINAEFLLILMHDINFRKLMLGDGAAEGSPRVLNTLAPALVR